MRIDWLETQVQSLGWEDPEKAMTTHSHILAWTVQGQRSSGLQSNGSHKGSDTTKQLSLPCMHDIIAGKNLT